MFWGLILKPWTKHTSTVKRPLHITRAAMETSVPVVTVFEQSQVMVKMNDGEDFLVCALAPGQSIQESLDIQFETGQLVTLYNHGSSKVHLTGSTSSPDNEVWEWESSSIRYF